MKYKLKYFYKNIWIYQENDNPVRYRVVFQKRLDNNRIYKSVYHANDLKKAKAILKKIKAKYNV